MVNLAKLQELVSEVQKRPKYSTIATEIIQFIGTQQLRKRSSLKEAIKGTLSKLHQIGGAYLEKQPDFDLWVDELVNLSNDFQGSEIKNFCLEKMRQHASTCERLPFLEEFYQTSLKSIAPVYSVLDLGCGINPLALPWIPLANDPMYFGIDIFKKMIDFDQFFLQYVHLRGKVKCGNFLNQLPKQKFQLALGLKVLPIVDQISRTVTRSWLEAIPADHMLLSFPIYSLNGTGKGMLNHYGDRFAQIVNKNWVIERFIFPTELAFLIHR